MTTNVLPPVESLDRACLSAWYRQALEAHSPELLAEAQPLVLYDALVTALESPHLGEFLAYALQRHQGLPRAAQFLVEYPRGAWSS